MEPICGTRPGSTSERANLDATRFEIVVKGRLAPTLDAAIEGFEVSRCDEGWSHMVGWVSDQARLHGTLELLRDLNIEFGVGQSRAVSVAELSEGRIALPGDAPNEPKRI